MARRHGRAVDNVRGNFGSSRPPFSADNTCSPHCLVRQICLFRNEMPLNLTNLSHVQAVWPVVKAHKTRYNSDDRRRESKHPDASQPSDMGRTRSLGEKCRTHFSPSCICGEPPAPGRRTRPKRWMSTCLEWRRTRHSPACPLYTDERLAASVARTIRVISGTITCCAEQLGICLLYILRRIFSMNRR